MTRKSKSLTLVHARELEWRESDLPSLEIDQVLVKTITTAVSIGSEIPVYSGGDTPIAVEYPKQMGYESYGEVIDVGKDVRLVGIGDKVVAFYGQKDYAVCRENEVIIVPEHIEGATALLTILSCDAAKGVLTVNPKPTDRVLVTGLGTMGLLSVYFLRQNMNVEYVDAVEPDAERANLGKLFGVNTCFSESPTSLLDYDVGFECSARNSAFQTLQSSMGRGGQICVLSDGNYDKFVLHPTFFEKELRVVGSSDGRNYEQHAEWFFAHVVKTPYVSELFQLSIRREDLIQCFEDLWLKRIQPIKVLVTY